MTTYRRASNGRPSRILFAVSQHGSQARGAPEATIDDHIGEYATTAPLLGECQALVQMQGTFQSRACI